MKVNERTDFIRQNIERVRERLVKAANTSGRDPADVQLIAISKNFPVSDLEKAYRCGQISFGENRVQELQQKWIESAHLDMDIDWHYVGMLQRNKVRFIIGRVSLIHSVGSLRLMRTIERLAARDEVVQDVLLQVNVSGEETKQGFEPDEVEGALMQCLEFSHIRVRGLMTMAPHYEDPEETRPVFRQLRELRDRLIARDVVRDLPELSMGMTNDFEQAIEEGATIIRVGSAIFGSRYE
ncbi:MAG TPA: YggS family pyridoxal phosphate-dependent enzyme [Clostridiaceae bacterium]|jgi:pyridoxal phosphate enzyme (YggS family)|nr:YggS family pyridoxal phosphate-dependent enzyme [Clostridiaceae bacterium]